MAPAKGNKQGKVNEGGRPKEYDRMEIGRQLVEWSKRADALTVPMFATSIGLHSGILRNWANEDEQFRALFFIAKENVGANRLRAVSNPDIKLDPGVYKQTAHFYDLDLKQDVRDEKVFDSNLKKAEADQMNSTAPSAIDLENMKMENQALRYAISKLTKANDSNNVS